MRFASVDILRGLIIVIMALDHVRDFFSVARLVDPMTMSPAYFLTRWVTHFCAPTFCFLAGTSACLSLIGGRRTVPELSWFLLTRGVWLVFADLTLIGFASFFNFSFPFTFGWLLLVGWSLGMSMIVLAGLVHVPLAVSVAFGAALVLGHNLFDGIRPSDLGAWGPVWNLLHVPGFVPVGPTKALVAYPLIPWIGVMALGYAFGALFRLPDASRRRTFVTIGLALTAAFVVLRAMNGYGEPRPWSDGGHVLLTAGSFLNTTKYPPSLAFLLMTLGPAIAALAWMERWRGPVAAFFTAFGRVPFFFYIVHFYLIHIALVATGWLQGFAPSAFLTFAPFLPKEFGLSLPAVYAVWAGLVLTMWPVCRWFGNVKARHQRQHAWLSYL